jgi:uncharacterized protein Yka (UPF0111/DUF47 family)
MAETDRKEFSSPVGKLLSFFQRSRDRWKRKHHQRKAQCKKLSNQVRAVEKSRGRWKQLAEERKRRIRQLERELGEQKSGGG